MEKNENLISIIAILYRWKAPILRLTVLAAAISVIVSLFLPNYYSSTTTFYAASTDLAKPEMIFGSTTKAMEYYGGDADIDRMLTIAESHELKDFLIDSFNLMKHYDIDSTAQNASFKIMEHLGKLYTVQKTKFDAIQLTVEDKNPKLAATMVNAARKRINDIALNLIRKNQMNLLRSYQTSMLEKQKELNQLDDSLIMSRKRFGIYNIEAQSELMGTTIAKKETSLTGNKGRLKIYQELSSPNTDTIMNLKANIRGLEDEITMLTDIKSPSSFTLAKFNNGVSKVEILQQLHLQARNRLSYDLERFNQLQNTLEADITSLILIETGQVPIVKSRPRRSLIVIASILAALLLGTITALLLDNYRNVNWKELLNA